MSFGEGFVTGLASSLDRALQVDMQRNMDRMSRAEEFATRRRLQKIEFTETKGRELKENLRELAALTGSNRRAAMAAEGVGGTSDAIAELVTDLKEQRKKLGKEFSVSKFIDFSGEETLTDPRTLVDNFNRFKPDVDFSAKIPSGMGKTTGLMGALGIEMKRDIGADVEATVPVDEEYTAPRDTSEIPSATISFAEGYEAREFAAKFEKNKDEAYKSTENILAYGQQLMLENKPGTDAHTQGQTYYDMAMQTLKEKKQNENADNATTLNPTTGIKIVDQVKNTFYDAEFTETTKDRLIAKLTGTSSYKAYFAAQPSVIDEIQKTTAAYNNDATLQNFLRVEQRAFNTNTQTYLNKFSQQDIEENKAYTFDEDGNATANAAIEPSATVDAQGKPLFGIGDMSMVKYYDPQNNTYIGDTVAVWMGNDWAYLE
tara:strand:+ start:2695 stop:3984 length:1290 start_codon:yes stop_codon:yes gene_type:complete